MASFSYEEAFAPTGTSKSFSYEDALGDAKPTPAKIGREGFKDILKKELADANPFTRNIAGAGTALSNLYEGAKQFVGAGDQSRIEENKIIEQAAPVGAFLGNAALAAVPFAAVGNSLKAAGAVGAGFGALNPVEGEQTLGNIVQGKLQNAAIGGALGAGGQALANKAGNYFAGKIANRADEAVRNAPIDKTLQDAIDVGLVVPLSAAKPTRFNNLLDSIGGKALTSQEFSNKNAGIIDALARKSVGLGENVPLTGDAMRSVRQAAFDRGYKPLQEIGDVPVDTAYASALDKIAAKYTGPAKSFPGAIDSEVPALAESFKVANFDAGEGLQAIQFLRDKASEAFRKGDASVGKASKEIANALEDQLERRLESAGQNGAVLLKQFRDARKLMAKAHTVEDAIVEGGGSINAKKLGSIAQSKLGRLSDELAIIGNFANNFPSAVKPAQQIQGPGVSALNFLSGGGFGAVGGMAGGPVGAALGVAAPFVVRPMARSLAMSRGMQNALAQRRLGLSAPEASVNALARYLPVGGTVLGLDTFGQ
jgi:hypothetical protein